MLRLPSPPLLLRTAGTLMLIVGLGVATWLVDKTLIRPWSEITGDLPFWVPFLATVLVGTGLLSALFFKAAQRLQPPPTNGRPSEGPRG